MNAYGQTGSMATLQNIGAQYAVSIVPGASQKTNLIHYYPPLIAVPIGTTIAWFNNDPGQPHTVTSLAYQTLQILVLCLTLALCLQLQTRSFNILSIKKVILYTIVKYTHGELQWYL